MRSGGAHEAVAHGETGLVVDDPTDEAAISDALTTLLDDEALRADMAVASRRRAEEEFSYDVLADRLRRAIDAMASS